MKSITIWFLLAVVFVSCCLANPQQRQKQQGKGGGQQQKQGGQAAKKANNGKAKANGAAQHRNSPAASGKMAPNGKKMNAPSKNQVSKPKQTQQRNAGFDKPGQTKISKKMAAAGALAAGGGAAGAGAFMAMPAVMPAGDEPVVGIGMIDPGQYNPEPYDMSHVDPMPPNFGGFAGPHGHPSLRVQFEIAHCMLPYESFTNGHFMPSPPNFMHHPPGFPFPHPPPPPPLPFFPPFLGGITPTDNEDPPTISADVGPEEAREMRINWLTQRVAENKPYTLDDPRLNFSDEDRQIAQSRIDEMRNGPLGLMQLLKARLPSIDQQTPQTDNNNMMINTFGSIDAAGSPVNGPQGQAVQAVAL